MRRLFVVIAAMAGLAACAPETIMASKDQAVIDAASPGSAVAEAQRECARYDRKPYFLRSNRRTYWFLCLPKDANTSGMGRNLQIGLRGDRDRDRRDDYRRRDDDRDLERRDDRDEHSRRREERHSAPPPKQSYAEPRAAETAPSMPMMAMRQPRVAPGYAMGQVPVMPQQPGYVMPPQGYVASNQPMFVPNLQSGPAQMIPMQPPVVLAPQAQMAQTNPPVIGSIVPPSAPPVVEGNPDGRYWVQVGASRTRNLASSLGRRVLNSNQDLLGNRQVLLQPTQVAGRGTYYRTHLGPFANRSEAETACGTLRQRNQACFPTTR